MDQTVYLSPGQHISTVVDGLLPSSRKQVISDELYFYIMSISLGTICQTITVFGIISNSINISVFVKQGFADKVNISLLALAVSDLTCLLFLMWSNVCFTNIMRDPSVPFVAQEVQVISGMWPHIVFTRVTGWITAFISFERCMCVIRPLKVKTIFTRRRHIASMIAIFTITVSCGALAYVSLGYGWKFYPELNATLIGLVYTIDVQKSRVADSIGTAVSGVIMPMTCFFSVLIFTTILVVKLNQQAAWRKASSSVVDDKTHRNKSLDKRDQKVAKMIVFISVVFIICYLPAVAIFVAGSLEPQLSYDGVYRNMFTVTLSISCTTQAINSSINIFIYFSMSTKYRETLLSKMSFIKRNVNGVQYFC